MRLKEIREQRRLRQRDIAEVLNCSTPVYCRYETGERQISMGLLEKLADFYQVSVDELLGRDLSERVLQLGLSPLPETRLIPLLGDIACGTPITAEENLDGYVNVPVDVTCHFALRCKGDSMSPRVQDGDLVYIRQQEDVTDGQIAAVLIDNEATLKHVYHTPGGVSLVAENPAYPPMIYTGEACNEVRILGLAVAYQRMLI